MCYRVKKVGGNATAVSTGNSERIPSRVLDQLVGGGPFYDLVWLALDQTILYSNL